MTALLVLTFTILGVIDTDTAARAALSAAETAYPGVESGGAIYSCEGTMAYSAPETQHKRNRVDITIYQNACTLVATFHTHPTGDARFSRHDITAACKLNVPAYIKPLGGAVRVFDCSTLSVPARKTAWEHPVLSRGRSI